MATQLTFECLGMTESELEVFCSQERIKALENQLNNVRRGLFKRHGELEKQLISCKEEIIELRMKIKGLENEERKSIS